MTPEALNKSRFFILDIDKNSSTLYFCHIKSGGFSDDLVEEEVGEALIGRLDCPVMTRIEESGPGSEEESVLTRVASILLTKTDTYMYTEYI